MNLRDRGFAKLNLALHVRGRRSDGRHELDTLFAFCVDGDRLTAAPADDLQLSISGSFGADLSATDNLVLRAAEALRERAGVKAGAVITLDKRLPVASGIGGGSADAAATLRLLTSLWGIDPAHASAIAPTLGADVPACLLSMTAHGKGVGDILQLADAPGVSGAPVLLVNPGVPMSTAAAFKAWDGQDGGPLGDWREGRNDLEAPARVFEPRIGDVISWLGQQDGAHHARMSGSGATCFALFDSDEDRDAAAEAVPEGWWHLATTLR